MAINKPYYRLYRQSLHRGDYTDATIGYDLDDLFLPGAERKSMLMSARLIIKDLELLFEYIEPHSNNVNVFSHRIYELLLRTCTEVESCCKGILKANGVTAKNMSDYIKIEQSSRLSAYSVHYLSWFPKKYESQPFASWASGGPLPWYQAYNGVKHNRWQSFQLASLDNLLNAISGLLCLIHAQIGDSVQEVFEANMYPVIDNPEVHVRSFTIIPPPIPDTDKYDFDWDVLKTDPNRFQQFIF